jgi:hypothetical protein
VVGFLGTTVRPGHGWILDSGYWILDIRFLLFSNFAFDSSQRKQIKKDQEIEH